MKRFVVASGWLMVVAAGLTLADDKALKELEGTYAATAVEKNGMAAPKDIVDSLRVTIRGDTLTIRVMNEEKKAKIKADKTKTPHTVDISPTDGPEKGRTFPGIYRIDKDEVTIVYTERGERPKEFKAEGEAVLLRMKKTD